MLVKAASSASSTLATPAIFAVASAACLASAGFAAFGIEASGCGLASVTFGLADAGGGGGALAWPGLLRKLDRVDPAYKS